MTIDVLIAAATATTLPLLFLWAADLRAA